MNIDNYIKHWARQILKESGELDEGVEHKDGNQIINDYSVEEESTRWAAIKICYYLGLGMKINR
jgi:hypothetical protein